MQDHRWREIESVLDLVLEYDREEWSRVLDIHCAHDSELRSDVEAILGRYTSAHQLMQTPPGRAAVALMTETADPAIHIGARVGAYRLVKQIGQGGSALVFLAQRDDGHFEQHVAIKFLRAGRATAIDQHAFRSERQILASLNHPNIAQLLDGGVTETDQPYLVLELVEGEPIDEYCRSRRLSMRAKLALFLDVLDATHYAHQKLVVHRDLKPANILVTRERRVLLLDFGLAKLLEPNVQRGATIRTLRHWMTPEYCAPEQVRGEPVTTLTDIYQLGAVLYELLTGQPPFGTRKQSSEALARAILEAEPAPPSTVVRELRGDLDAIVLHALRKEPERRYRSARAFADDIRRHLQGHPVLARRQSPLYTSRRFVRRHPLALVAMVALIVGVSAYTATVSMQRTRATRALAQATIEAEKASQVETLMLTLFESSGSGRAFADTTSARALLKHTYARVGVLTGEPTVRAELLELIGRISAQLGDHAQANAAFNEARAVRASRETTDRRR